MEPEFDVGAAVTKRSGDYVFEGVVVARFMKRSGSIRYVVEDVRGLLLIMNAKQLAAVEIEEQPVHRGEG